MAFNVQDIRSNLKLGGARPTLFQVQITNPASAIADFTIPFLVQAATIPEASLGTIEVPYMGRKIKLAGDRTYQAWSVTVINDEDFAIRNAMEVWSNRINSFVGNLRNFPTSAPAEYKSEALVHQYDKIGNIIRTYRFSGIYPAGIGNIPLSWGDTDTIEHFTVQFMYDWWVVDAGTTGDAGGE